MTINQAEFLIDGEGADDDGNLGVDAVAGQTLVLTLVQNPSPALLVRYEVYDPDNDDSPLASAGAPQLLFGNDEPSQEPDLANDPVELEIVEADLATYLVRCTVSMPEGPHVFERMVCVRVNGLRALLPFEAEQYGQRGPNDAINEAIAAIAGGGGGSGAGGYSDTRNLFAADTGTTLEAGVFYLFLEDAAGVSFNLPSALAIAGQKIRFNNTPFAKRPATLNLFAGQYAYDGAESIDSLTAIKVYPGDEYELIAYYTALTGPLWIIHRNRYGKTRNAQLYEETNTINPGDTRAFETSLYMPVAAALQFTLHMEVAGVAGSGGAATLVDKDYLIGWDDESPYLPPVDLAGATLLDSGAATWGDLELISIALDSESRVVVSIKNNGPGPASCRATFELSKSFPAPSPLGAP